MRCRGATYQEIARELGYSAVTINLRLDHRARKRHYALGLKWRKANPDKLRQCKKESRKRDPERAKREYRQNRKNRLASDKKHYQKNKKEILRRKQARLSANPQSRLSRNLRSRITTALRRATKGGSAVRDLGCTVPELMVKLEAMFAPGMTWENHGSKWHVDHVKPLILFDLTVRSEFLKACHFSNLQPLWAEDNLRKGARYEST